MNFTTMHRELETCMCDRVKERAIDWHTERATRERMSTRDTTAIGIMIRGQTKTCRNAHTHTHTYNVYLLSYFIKTVLLLLWIENCHHGPNDRSWRNGYTHSETYARFFRSQCQLVMHENVRKLELQQSQGFGAYVLILNTVFGVRYTLHTQADRNTASE